MGKKNKQKEKKERDFLVSSNYEGLTGVIVVSSGKGGVGKTTTAMALGGAALLFGCTPVVIDMDHGTSATEAYNYTPATPYAALLAGGSVSLEDAIHSTPEGVDFVPSDPEIRAVPDGMVGPWAQRLRELGRDRLIIIDVSDEIRSTPVASALLAADIVVTPVPMKKKDLRRSVTEIDGFLAASGASAQRLFIAAMLEDNLNVSALVGAELRSMGKELAAKIPKDTAVNEADFLFKSVVAYKPKSRASRAYIEFTDRLFGRLALIKSYTVPLPESAPPRPLPASLAS